MNYTEYGNLVNNPPAPITPRVGSVVKIDADDPVFQCYNQDYKANLNDEQWKYECSGLWVVRTEKDYTWIENNGTTEVYDLKSLSTPQITSWYSVPSTAIKIVKY